MKTITTIPIIIIAALLLIPHVATSTRVDYTAPRQIYIAEGSSVMLDALTIYHPSKRQCDKTPLITASNAKINTEKLKNQKIRWMALSRDLLNRWKGEFHYGDTVRVQSGDPQIDGLWVIKDTMNKRFKNRGDLLFDHSVRKSGKWNNVAITRVTSITV